MKYYIANLQWNYWVASF